MNQRVFVDSACITSASFVAETSVLQLEFRNGLSYEYFGVPADLFSALLASPSKGSFISRFIRGKFEFRRL
jgi:hypothetical protein